MGFLTQRDCKRCFGYKGGHAQRAVWKIPNTDIHLWFPKLYKNKDWDNSIDENLSKIIMQRTSRELLWKANKWKMLVFAHNKNVFGQTLYKFLGLFELNEKKSNLKMHVFNRMKTKINLNKL